MIKKVLSIVISITLVMGFSTVSLGDKVTYGDEIIKSGEKSKAQPGYSEDGYFEINSMDDIGTYALTLMTEPSTNARLMNDLNFPQGSSKATIYAGDFTGIFDGNGHTLNIGNSDGGLFTTNKGTIQDLKIVYNNVSNTSADTIGVFADTSEGTIQNCISEGNMVTGLHRAGGIAGLNKGTIKNCIGINNNYIKTVATGSIRMAGGLVGENDPGVIQDCISKGTGTIFNNTGDGGSGGITGWNDGLVSGCICEGSLKITANARDYSGGIAGKNSSYGSGVDNCLVTGDVRLVGAGSGIATGGIVGKQERVVSNCFYNASGVIGGSTKNGPVIGYRETGKHGSSKYNTDKTSLNNGLGTGINNIYWLDKGDKVTLSFTEDPANGFTCAGRYFYYGDNQVTCGYDGTVGEHQYVEYKLNQTTFTSNEFTMPKSDSTITTKVVTQKKIGDVHPSFKQSEVVYDGISHRPSSLNSDDGVLKENEDYTATFTNSKGVTVSDCIYDDTYTMTITGINNYYSNASLTLVINKGTPTFIKEPVAKTLDYNGDNLDLLEAGSAEHGTILYKHTDGEYSEAIPQGQNAGDYPIKYMIKGDDHYKDSKEYSALATINRVDSSVTKEPKANKLKYNGKDQKLVTAGTTNDGTFMYSVGNTKSYSEKMPTGKRVGTYDVYWKVVGDKNHEDYVSKTPIKVTIKSTGATLYKLTPKGKKLNIVWNQRAGADGYDVFFAKCGKKLKLKKTVTANVDRITIKGLKKNGCYKIKIKAFCKVNGKKQYIKSYPLVHTYMMKSTKRYTVPKKVTTNVSSITLAKGNTYRVVAKVIKKNKKKKLMPTKHAPLLRYFSLDTDIATIDDSGLVKAKAKGTSVVYAYAVNGKYKAINITVK